MNVESREYDDIIAALDETGKLSQIVKGIACKRYVTVSFLQREFELGFVRANAALRYLIEHHHIEEEQVGGKGYRVIAKNLDMRIFLIDLNPTMEKAWNRYFGGHDDVEVVREDFASFMNAHDVECIVSPANSFGEMSGGYDLAIRDYFGEELEEAVQDQIDRDYYGEQPVGSSLLVPIPETGKKLIHTPTMRLPEVIRDPMVIYTSMRSTLICAIKANVSSILIPAFGAGTGRVPCDTVAKMMFAAYRQIVEYR